MLFWRILFNSKDWDNQALHSTDLSRYIYPHWRLCPALKSIFLHGMRKPSILGGPCHPWLFMEEVSESPAPLPFKEQELYSSLGPKIKTLILLTIYHAFLLISVMRIGWFIRTISLSWWFSSFPSLACLIMYWYCNEKLNFDHSWELKG